MKDTPDYNPYAPGNSGDIVTDTLQQQYEALEALYEAASSAMDLAEKLSSISEGQLRPELRDGAEAEYRSFLMDILRITDTIRRFPILH